MDRGQALHAARRRKRMSQEHLASVAGVSVRTVRRGEVGEAISDESLRCLCATLELQAEDWQDEPAPKIDDVLDRTRPEDVDSTLTVNETRVVQGFSCFPGLTAAVAAILVLMGAWPAAGVLTLGYLAAQLVAVFAIPGVAARCDAPTTAILVGIAYVHAGVLWLIHLSAGSPKALQVVVLAQIVAGTVMMAVGVLARHREWRERETPYTGNGA